MEVIFTQHHGINQKFKTVLKTFKKFSDDIWNSVKEQYSNGPLECMNNHIKVLKGIAYDISARFQISNNTLWSHKEKYF
jgi:transposase